MRLLLDTHVVLWWFSDDARLGQYVRDLIADPVNDVLVSVVSLWEIQVKVRAGKLRADMQDIFDEIEAQAFELLPIGQSHLIRLGKLPAHHKDPFDHLLIAQAVIEGAIFISQDRHTPDYAVNFMTCSESGRDLRDLIPTATDFDRCQNPSTAKREREGPDPKGWEGEGSWGEPRLGPIP